MKPIVLMFYSFLTRNFQTKKVIPNKEIKSGKSSITFLKYSHPRNKINMEILHEKIVQNKTREFSDKKNIHAK